MITKKYVICADLLNLLMLFLLSVIISWCCVVGISGSFYAEAAAGMAVLLVLLYLLRLYVKNLFLYIALHVVLFAVLFTLPLPVIAAAELIAFLIVFTITDFAFWTDATLHGFYYVHVSCCLFFLMAYAYGGYKDAQEMQSAAYVMGILFLGLYFLRLYFENGIKFSKEKQMNEEVPLKQMYAQSVKLILPLVGIFVVCMFLIQSKTLADFLLTVLRLIVEKIIYFINWLISILPRIKGANIAISELPEELFFAADAPPYWVQMLIRLLEMFISAAIVGFLIFISLRGVYRFFRTYLLRNGREEHLLFYQDMSEKREWISEKKEQTDKHLFGRLSGAEKIRRLYKKKIRALERSGYRINRSDTPMERAADVYESRGEDILEATAVYEEARYGNDLVSEETVRKMKSCL